MKVSELLDAAQAHLTDGRVAAAQTLFTEAMEHPGGAARAAGGLGRIALRAGELEQAQELFGRGLVLAPENAELLVGLAVVHLCAQRLEDAEACLLRAMRLDPMLPEAPCNLATILLLRRDLQGARDMARRAYELAPETPDTIVCLANVEMQCGDIHAARALLEKSAALAPDRAGSYIGLGTVFRMTGEVDRAAESLERARMLEPDSPAVLASLAECRLALGEFATARRLVRQAVAVAPADGNVRTVEGMILLHSGQEVEALASLRLAARYSPESPAPLVNLALLMRRSHQWDAAMAAVREAIALAEPASGGARRLEVDLLFLAGAWRSAWLRFDELKALGRTTGNVPELPAEGIADLGSRLALIVDDLASSLLGLRLLPGVAGAERRIRILCLPAYAGFFRALPWVDCVEAREEINGPRDIEAGETALLLDELPRLLRATPAHLAPLGLDAPEPSADDTRPSRDPGGSPVIGLWWDDTPGGAQPQMLLDALPGVPMLLREPNPGQVLTLPDGATPQILVDHGVDELLVLARILVTLDLVVCVDGPVAHLAATLGCPTVVICQLDAAWYWQPCGPEKARWYPSARAVGRDSDGRWSGLTETCEHLLADPGACPGVDTGTGSPSQA